MSASADAPAVLTAAAASRRRGDYAASARLCAAALDAGAADGALVVERIRALLADGRPRDARLTLDRYGEQAGMPASRLMLALYDAWLPLIETGDAAETARRADAAMAAAGLDGLDPADAAEIGSLLARIRLSVARLDASRAPPPADPAALAETLLALGRIDVGLETLLAWADTRPADAFGAAIDRVRDAALAHGRPDFAARALVNRAEKRIATEQDRLVEADLAAADALYLGGGHRHGRVDVRAVAARLNIERDAAPLQGLVDAASDYERLDHPHGELRVLLDLSTYAHERGELALARRARDRLAALGEAVGMGLLTGGNGLRDADLLMRAGDYAAARDCCLEALARDPPAELAAGFEHLLGTALGFAGDRAGALAAARRGLALLAETGSDASASTTVVKLAADLGSGESDADLEEAERLIVEWIGRDLARGDLMAAAFKRELQIDLRINAYRLSPSRRGDPALLGEAEALLAEARALLPARRGDAEAARRGAGLEQRRATLAMMRDDDEGADAAHRAARAIFEGAALAFEAANCSFILGCLYLNRANVELMPAFGEAETNLKAALDYYAGAGMREPAANAREKLGLLYANAAFRTDEALALQLREAAIAHLSDGIADLEAVRAAFWSRNPRDARERKRSLGAKAGPLIELAIGILMRLDRPGEAWAWIQRSKGRALSDLLGGHVELRPAMFAALQSRPDLRALVRDENELVDTLATASARDTPGLRTRLTGLWERMRAEPALADYVELRTGEAADLDDMRQLLAGLGRPAALVDWFAIKGRLYLSLLRGAAEPVIVPLPLDEAAVSAFVARNLGADSYRGTLRDVPELLDEMAPLVAPLGELAAADETSDRLPDGSAVRAAAARASPRRRAADRAAPRRLCAEPRRLARLHGARRARGPAPRRRVRRRPAGPGRRRRDRRRGRRAARGEGPAGRRGHPRGGRRRARRGGFDPFPGPCRLRSRRCAAVPAAPRGRRRSRGRRHSRQADPRAHDPARRLRGRGQPRRHRRRDTGPHPRFPDGGRDAGGRRAMAGPGPGGGGLHARILRPAEAVPVIDAVRGAMLALRADDAFSTPLSWAPFMLYGAPWEVL